MSAVRAPDPIERGAGLGGDAPHRPPRAPTQEALEKIERNARAQAQLVNDILDVSRIITGKLRLDVGPVDLVAVVEAAVDVVRLAAQAKGSCWRRRWIPPRAPSSAMPAAYNR